MSILDLLDLHTEYFDGRALAVATRNIQDLASNRYDDKDGSNPNSCLEDIESNAKDLNCDFETVEKGLTELEDKLKYTSETIMSILNEIDSHKCKSKEDYDSLLEDIYSNLNGTVNDMHKLHIDYLRYITFNDKKDTQIKNMLKNKGLTWFIYDTYEDRYINNFNCDMKVSFKVFSVSFGTNVQDLLFNGVDLIKYMNRVSDIIQTNPFTLDRETATLIGILAPEYQSFVDNFIVNDNGEYIN